MNRQRATQLPISSRPVQQGLFVILALLVTLMAGLVFQRWAQPAVEAPRVPFQIPTQTHFSAVGTASADRGTYTLTPVEQAEPLGERPQEQRWVF